MVRIGGSSGLAGRRRPGVVEEGAPARLERDAMRHDEAS